MALTGSEEKGKEGKGKEEKKEQGKEKEEKEKEEEEEKKEEEEEEGELGSMEEDETWLGRKIRNGETRKWEKRLERVSGWEIQRKSGGRRALELTVNTVAQLKPTK